MIHEVEVTNHTIVSVASFLARAPDGQQVIFIIEGPPVEKVAPSYHDKELMTAVFKKYKPLDSNCIFLWVRPAYLFGNRVIQKYYPDKSNWEDAINIDALSDLRVEGGPNVETSINNYENQLLRAAKDPGLNDWR